MKELEHRIQTLERRVYRQRITTLFLVLTLALFLSWGASLPQAPAEDASMRSGKFSRIEAEEFVVVRDGREWARLGFNRSMPDTPGLAIRGKRGREQIQLYVLGGNHPDMTFSDPKSRVRLWASAVNEGVVSIRLHGPSGRQLGSMVAGENQARFVARTEDGRWWTSTPP